MTPLWAIVALGAGWAVVIELIKVIKPNLVEKKTILRIILVVGILAITYYQLNDEPDLDLDKIMAAALAVLISAEWIYQWVVKWIHNKIGGDTNG